MYCVLALRMKDPLELLLCRHKEIARAASVRLTDDACRLQLVAEPGGSVVSYGKELLDQ